LNFHQEIALNTRRTTLKAVVAGLAIGFAMSAMPTKSSARWISDGDNMVKQFRKPGYKTDLQYAEDDIPTSWPRSRT
jgi:ABC-type xylose transport system substrate-binding protein